MSVASTPKGKTLDTRIGTGGSGQAGESLTMLDVVLDGRGQGADRSVHRLGSFVACALERLAERGIVLRRVCGHVTPSPVRELRRVLRSQRKVVDVELGHLLVDERNLALGVHWRTDVVDGVWLATRDSAAAVE